MRIDNLKDGEVTRQAKRTRRVETAAPLGFSSVSRGRTRFVGNESLLVEGSQKVSGWLIITGTLKIVGAFLLEGITTISGALTSTGTALFTGAFTARGTTRFEGDTTQVGPFHVQGNADVTGTLGIKGEATLENNLVVTSGGKVTVGNMKIGEGTHGSGKGVSFTNGGALSADGSSVEVYAASGGLMRVGTTQSALYLGANGVIVDGSGVRVSGLSLNTALTPNVHIDGTGRLWRTS